MAAGFGAGLEAAFLATGFAAAFFGAGFAFAAGRADALGLAAGLRAAGFGAALGLALGAGIVWPGMWCPVCCASAGAVRALAAKRISSRFTRCRPQAAAP